jgi:hypothetical protein
MGHMFGKSIEMPIMAAVDGLLGRLPYAMFRAHGDNHDVGERWRIVCITADYGTLQRLGIVEVRLWMAGSARREI